MDLWLLVVIVAGATLVLGFGIAVVRGRIDAARGPGEPPRVPADLDATVRRLVAEGRTVQAVKDVRTHTGLGLKEAKQHVDQVAAGTAPPGGPVPGAAVAPDRTISAEALPEIRRLIARGSTIQAIKEVRAHTGLGLEEAKDLVERLATAPPTVEPAPPTVEPTPPAAGTAAPGASPPVPPEVVERARVLAAQGQKLQAIKEVRAHTGLGLEEAKGVVDRL